MGENMNEQSEEWLVYEKTEKGVEEIQTRRYNLSQKFRTLLIVVDGKKTRGSILNQFATLEGVATVLGELEQKGFIMKKAGVLAPGVLTPLEEKEKAKLAKAFMINTLNDAVGSMGLSLIESLKKCETLDELKSQFENYLYAIRSGRGKATADEYREELLKLFPSKE
jgi:hypothetical protein